MTSAELIQGCVEQNRRAQRELFYSYSKQLMAVAMRYTRDEATAKDVVQESFIKIYKSIGQLNNTKEYVLVAWMKKITIRQSLRQIEQNKSFQSKKELFEERLEAAAKGLELQDVLKTLASLPEGYRRVFELFVIDGYSHKEIGELLHIEASSSRSQLTRARAMFQERWSQKENYYEKQ